MSYCFKLNLKKASKISEKEKIGIDDETMLSALLSLSKKCVIKKQAEFNNLKLLDYRHLCCLHEYSYNCNVEENQSSYSFD